MLKEHIIPVSQKLKDEAKRVEAHEEQYLQDKRRGVVDAEAAIQEV
jgi:hypothetical protein